MDDDDDDRSMSIITPYFGGKHTLLPIWRKNAPISPILSSFGLIPLQDFTNSSEQKSLFLPILQTIMSCFRMYVCMYLFRSLK